MRRGFHKTVGLFLLLMGFMATLTVAAQDKFPVPTGNPNQLFYLQRTANTNTIICELNYTNNNVLNAEEPVHVFWLRYTDKGQKEELNFIQKKFAYGIKSTPDSQGKIRA